MNGTPAEEGGLRIEIVAGGQPTDEELAAIVVALSAASAGAARVAMPPHVEEEGWLRAARWEALGEPPFVSAADVWVRARPAGA